MLPDYKLIGAPNQFRNGHGKRSSVFLQKYRLLSEKKVRSVSLQTTDAAMARRRAVKYVEDKIRRDLLARDPQARTVASGIHVALQEYLDDLTAMGNSPKQIAGIKTRISRVIEQAKFKEYSHLDCVLVTKAISKLSTKHKFGVSTANNYRESLRAWSAWMRRNRRWPTNVLEDLPKIKGDTTSTRPRTILTDAELEHLLRVTLNGPDRRNLSGEERYWLYLLASQTGLRAQELDSLRPSSFHLDGDAPYVEIRCTVSKRRKTDRVLLRKDFAAMLRVWFEDQEPNRRLWIRSGSWSSKAADMLRRDLEAAGIAHKRGEAIIDFHSFRALRITKCVLSGTSSRVVMQTVRLSSEALLDRYTKLPQQAIAECVDAVPLPRLLHIA